MGDNSGWCTIESDPGVFTELIQQIGVKDVQVEELYTLDSSEFLKLKPIFGLIFLFKWTKDDDTRQPVENDSLFFANQVIHNACATQAILSILMNSKDIDVGEELNNFKQFTTGFSYTMKGEAIGDMKVLRENHNSFSRPEPFIFGSKPAKKDDDVFHFISYIPFEGKIYELDGLKRGPICLGECTDDDWLEKVSPIIQERINKYSQTEIRFNLMAIIRNKQSVYNKQLEFFEAKKKATLLKLSQIDTAVEQAMDIDSDAYSLPNDRELLDAVLLDIDNNMELISQNLMMEQEKFRNWREENVRRKHNYIPFIINLLKILAEKEELVPLIQKAKDKESNKAK
ncbi:hypothetical protein SAMD00019534_052780 [Acytostelium subglobosum LB1]|uniref:hypothetical protein n=1 Tax=Acytostelium subglobosum LB1 TaxID=1410327 RepID=UPI000644D549|nr:hypothetical protein SAMD00019534_052780 [Acytostelium subglobosum LB1]GAM22103.1 hypothetical protein SAMD00019534_052780 [Acytostelium subglobosum LB1]|eukprot:XP_012755203.1 hypothetical protein SAMD00019534_052780 [Acytostelium subglobosum LB1]